MRRGFPAHPSSVARARKLVREHLTRTGHDDMLETAELVVSEMVTNAIVHTGSEVELAMSLDEAGLKVEVADSGSHLPMLSSYGAMASTGRGLRLVDRLVDGWGVEPRQGGKVIWFRLGRTGSRRHSEQAAEAQPADAAAAPDVVDVALCNVPLLVHRAWQQHAKALLREFLLVGLDDEVAHRIELHAAAMEALAVLWEQLPVPEFHDDPVELMTTAVEPYVSGDHHVLVPRDSVPHFEVLDQQMEAALAEAGSGRLLTPPTQPEFAEFRRWVCEQVRRQAEGGEPGRWDGLADLAPADAAVPEWDASAVTGSSTAVVAADDTGRIVAASEPAATLLKVPSTDDLVGSRLVSIIPTRFRQAHLAAFTLHQITGRGSLLGRTVVVPARCHDDSEVVVRLRITRSQVAGNAVFVADLAPAAE